MKKPQISVFVPIYNEEKILEFHIRILKKYLNLLPYTWELFIVNDGSIDMSTEVMRDIVKRDKRIKHIYYKDGKTRRENLAASFKYANSNIIVMLDMDLSSNLKYLRRLIDEVKVNNYDIVIGSRYIKGSKIKRGFFRLLVSRAFITGCNIYYGSNISDYECGFKAFKKPVILDLIREAGYDKTKKRSVFWDAEILMRAEKKHYSIKEIPIEWTEGAKSELHFSREVKMLPYMLRFKKALRKA
ncbi:MAG: glycosyltransferase [Candidatus Woesearchaeota archaeon]|nr:MAG: glycosyltransferase [Candidatus Woesearchaeota archaeon]